MSRQIPARLIEADEHSFYRSEAKIHPRNIRGPLQRLRWLAVWVLLGMFYLFPWLRYDGRQAVLFDLPARKFYVFGLNFWPQDFFLLTLLLASAALALFFFTTLAGRLWCGYACPQTVWTEVYFFLEQLTEGNRGQRIKLDAAPWNGFKLRKRGLKYLIFALFALWTGLSFVGFFSPMSSLVTRFFTLDASAVEYFWVGFYALATFGNAGFLREQVCKYMCPYARFQSAMFDRDTLLIAYDTRRGEPRGPRRRDALASVLSRARGLLSGTQANAYLSQSAEPTNSHTHRLPLEMLGDCIDCEICVQVCPTGIDIRQGLQYECIACGACVDGCASVMSKMGYPQGLIRYTSLAGLEGKATRLLRARVVLYGAVLATLLGLFAYGVTHRNALLVDALHDRGTLYRQGVYGIENDYTLKLANKLMVSRRVFIDLAPAQDFTLVNAPLRIELPAEMVQAIPLVLRATTPIHGRKTVKLIVYLQSDAAKKHPVHKFDVVFFGPAS